MACSVLGFISKMLLQSLNVFHLLFLAVNVLHLRHRIMDFHVNSISLIGHLARFGAAEKPTEWFLIRA